LDHRFIDAGAGDDIGDNRTATSSSILRIQTHFCLAS
jgi:hypothetical protein